MKTLLLLLTFSFFFSHSFITNSFSTTQNIKNKRETKSNLSYTADSIKYDKNTLHLIGNANVSFNGNTIQAHKISINKKEGYLKAWKNIRLKTVKDNKIVNIPDSITLSLTP